MNRLYSTFFTALTLPTPAPAHAAPSADSGTPSRTSCRNAGQASHLAVEGDRICAATGCGVFRRQPSAEPANLVSADGPLGRAVDGSALDAAGKWPSGVWRHSTTARRPSGEAVPLDYVRAIAIGDGGRQGHRLGQERRSSRRTGLGVPERRCRSHRGGDCGRGQCSEGPEMGMDTHGALHTNLSGGQR